jgi:hypothetical protein
MRYMWRIFKYSKPLENERSGYSHCNTDLGPLGQTMSHLHYDSQEMRKERWMHIIAEGDRSIELIQSPDALELRLNIISARSQSVVILERIELGQGAGLRICMKQKLAGCKHGDSGRFQVMFYSNEEADSFNDKLGSGLSYASRDMCNRKLLQSFLDLSRGARADSVRGLSTSKTSQELIREFMLLVHL